MLKFPDGFLWGGAIAANQSEGGFLADGALESVVDHCTSGNRTTPRKFTHKINENLYYPSHDGIDFYHHYREDIKLFKEIGFKTLRLSVTWSRIFPNGDDEFPNEKGIEFYRNVFEELKNNDIEPLVTISHYDLPYSLALKYGGWKNRKLIGFYEKLCEVLFTRYKGLVKYWLTFNEINVLANGYGDIISAGLLPENDSLVFTSLNINDRFEALHNQFLASAKAVIMAHKIDPENKVGCMVSSATTYPYTCHPSDVLCAQQRMDIANHFCSDVQCRGEYPYYTKKYFNDIGIDFNVSQDDAKILKEGKVDFFSFSYYMSSCVSATQSADSTGGNMTSGMKNPYLETSDWGWQIDPVGLRYYLNDIYGRYQIPIFIVENGLGAFDELVNEHVDDEYRINYLKAHIEAIADAIEDGVEIIGYTPWGCIDLVSLGTGEMDKRYGFIYVDKNNEGIGTFKRYKKSSFDYYKKVIATNGEYR